MSPTTTGARSASGRTRKPLGWLPWVLLLVLALVIALVVLIVVGSNDDDEEDGTRSDPSTALVADQSAIA
jgi:hypothetical protein